MSSITFKQYISIHVYTINSNSKSELLLNIIKY